MLQCGNVCIGMYASGIVLRCSIHWSYSYPLTHIQYVYMDAHMAPPYATYIHYADYTMMEYWRGLAHRGRRFSEGILRPSSKSYVWTYAMRSYSKLWRDGEGEKKKATKKKEKENVACETRYRCELFWTYILLLWSFWMSESVTKRRFMVWFV